MNRKQRRHVWKPSGEMFGAEVNKLLPSLRLADVVIVRTRDGNQGVIKGRAILDRIQRTGVPEVVRTQFCTVHTLELAAALEQILGWDGTIDQPLQRARPARREYASRRANSQGPPD